MSDKINSNSTHCKRAIQWGGMGGVWLLLRVISRWRIKLTGDWISCESEIGPVMTIKSLLCKRWPWTGGERGRERDSTVGSRAQQQQICLGAIIIYTVKWCLWPDPMQQYQQKMMIMMDHWRVQVKHLKGRRVGQFSSVQGIHFARHPFTKRRRRRETLITCNDRRAIKSKMHQKQ